MPKKKRAVKKTTVINARNAAKSTASKVETVVDVAVQEKPKKVKPAQPIIGTTMVTRRHKKFGKFHCLVEEPNQIISSEGILNKTEPNQTRIDTLELNVREKESSEEILLDASCNETEVSTNEAKLLNELQTEMFISKVDEQKPEECEDETDIVTFSGMEDSVIIESQNIESNVLMVSNIIDSNSGNIEIQTVEDVLEKMNASDSESNEINEVKPPPGFVEIVEYPENSESATEEIEESEISLRLSNLDVNIIHFNENEEIFIDSTQDVDNSENIFHVENFDNDVNIVECIAEEIIEPAEETVEINEMVILKENDSNCANEVIEVAEDSLKAELKVEENSVSCENKNDNMQEIKTPEEQSHSKGVKSKSVKKPRAKNTQPRSRAKAKQKSPALLQNSDSNGSSTASESSVRRSNRIKSISVLKRRSKGHGLVKSIPNKSLDSDTSENSNSGQVDLEKTLQEFSNFVAPSTNCNLDQKPVKVKSRWRRSSELEMGTSSPSLSNRSSPYTVQENVNLVQEPVQSVVDNLNEVEARLKQFVHLKENHYLTERLSCKEARKMTCDCFLTPEEIDRGEYGCGEDCLNRLLMIECGGLCPVGERCTNKRFQKLQFAPCEVFKTDKKGLGIRAKANIPYGEFILEYVGEVLDPHEFENRASEYSKDNNRHYYFMSLRADAVIDATLKGNISRFINHSCDPNAETQKWTVNGELRIGFFSKRTILAGEEITFDYQFQRYGKEAQKCFCESALCRGWLGEEPEGDDDEDDEDEEYEELDEEKYEAIENKLEGKEKVETTVEQETKEITEVPKKVTVKKPRNKVVKRKTRKEIFDDLDQLDREIDSLFTTGLKNQAQTLKLSRLMVRAKEPSQRSKLLKLLRNGEFPCRRLFLDYHGLRLIHGWMTDAQHMVATDKKIEALRLEILQTLATLPIPNKTMLQDSKVLPTVEKWSIPTIITKENLLDSDSNSPKPEIFIEKEDTPKEYQDRTEIIVDDKIIKEESIEDKLSLMMDEVTTDSVDIGIALEVQESLPLINEPEICMEEKTETCNDENLTEVHSSLGEKPPDPEIDMEVSKTENIENENDKKSIEEITNLQREDMDISPISFEEKDIEINKTLPTELKVEEFNYEEEIIALAVKLLEEWSILKEVFRIPKKERIEQMKEHEREADRKYKAGLGLELEHIGIKKSENRYRILQRHRSIEKIESSDRHRKHLKVEDRNIVPLPRISKHERRKLFAMQVEHAEEERRRKQRELWRKHEQHCIVMGTDPRFTAPYDASQGYHCIWNPQTGQWQNYPIPPGSQSNIYNPNIPPQHAPPYNYGNIPMMQPSIANLSPNLVHYPNLSPAQQQVLNHMPQTMNQMPSQPPHQMQISPLNQSTVNPTCIPQTGPNHNMNHIPLNHSAKAHMSYQESAKEEDPTQVKFMGPIPPPVKLPPKWKCAKDKYGRPYYYHIKIRKSQWEPPSFSTNEEESDTSSSSDTSSLSSDSSSEDSESDEDMLDDSKLMLEIRSKFKQMEEEVSVPVPEKVEKKASPKRKMNINDFVKETDDDSNEEEEEENENQTFTEEKPSIDMRLKDLLKKDEKGEPIVKKRRAGLVEERIISPRTDEDRLQYKEDVKRYKENKAKLKRQKEMIIQQTKKQIKVKALAQKKHKTTVKTKLKEMTVDKNSEAAKKIKETFRSNMASVMVGILNAYRKPDCKEGRITNTDDFKHLARKLTHFVMLKELKHCSNIDDLTCTDSVKSKAKEFVRKYMCKFGDVYQRPKDDLEYY